MLGQKRQLHDCNLGLAFKFLLTYSFRTFPQAIFIEIQTCLAAAHELVTTQ